MNFQDLPKDMQGEIFRLLSIKDKLQLGMVSKQLQTIFKAYIWRDCGASSYEEFMSVINETSSLLIALILKDKENFNLAKSPIEERRKILNDRNIYTESQAAKIKIINPDIDKLLLSDNGIVMLLEGKIIPEEIASESDFSKTLKILPTLGLLLSEGGIKLLRTEKLTLKQAIEVTPYKLKILLNKNGVRILLEDKFTIEKILTICGARLKPLLSNEAGLRVLTNGKKTPLQLDTMEFQELLKLIKNEEELLASEKSINAEITNNNNAIPPSSSQTISTGQKAEHEKPDIGNEPDLKRFKANSNNNNNNNISNPSALFDPKKEKPTTADSDKVEEDAKYNADNK